MNLFPYSLRCSAQGTFVHSAREYQDIVILEAKRRKTSWYAYDVDVLSPVCVKITVYDILDTVYGGIGEFKFEFTTPVFESKTRKTTVERAIELAQEQRRREVIAEEERIIARYADELLSSASRRTSCR